MIQRHWAKFHKMTRAHTATKAKHGIRRHRIAQPAPMNGASQALQAAAQAIAQKLGLPWR